ncbi:MAG: SUMF1/EgtB/PvdO family nonheme iron enzyme [Burkholderiales bacterium]
MLPVDPTGAPAPAEPSGSSHHAGGDAVDSPTCRQARRDLLSLALIDSRNLTLQAFGLIERAQAGWPAGQMEHKDAAGNLPLWLLGHVGWFAERWTLRNTQRSAGPRCPGEPTRIASIEPHADEYWDPVQRHADGPGQELHGNRSPLPTAEATRSYLLETLEDTLDLLEKTPDEDDSLYFFRAALAHEDACGEALLVAAQTLGLTMPIEAPGSMHQREPLACPATRGSLGSPSIGYVPAIEQPEHLVPVPAFEIDAQPVCWAQFIEFVDDGGYDREDCWNAAGWQWLQAQTAEHGRRGPRHVEQIGAARFGGSGAVVQRFFGRSIRLAGNQPVMHASWFEADAWARWAGRRLPTEVEWEFAAQVAARRGFRWGDVLEWTATTLRPWPGYVADPFAAAVESAFGAAKVLRGASFATRQRQHHLKFRRFAWPHQDDGFVGFRTCAI